jgi:hypothetical protein
MVALALGAAHAQVAKDKAKDPLPGILDPKGKKPEPPKPIPKNVTEAERKLLEFNCSLHRAGEKHEDKLRINRLNPFLPFNPFVPLGPVDHVAFPETTKDADLVRLMPFVAKLPQLKSIDLGGCENITEKGIKSLAQLKHLEALFLDRNPVTAAWLKELAGVKGLKWLDISATPLADEAMGELGGIQQLNTLIVHHLPNLTAAGVKKIVAVNQLRFLDITVEKNPNAMCESLATARTLSALKVSPVGDEEDVHLGKMASLDTLDLSNELADAFRLDKPLVIKPKIAGPRFAGNNHITDKGLNLLTGCTMLRVLDLTNNSDIKGDGIDEFTRMKRLEEIYLRGTAFTNGGATKLSAMTTLRLIDLRQTAITDAAASDLADLPAVQRLYLALNSITDSGLKELTRLRSLQVLDLSGTKVSAVGVRDLKNLSQLEHLHLAATRVTTSSFPALASVKSLRFLNLLDNCPDVTHETIQPLKDELPGCLVLASHCPRGGDVMGINGLVATGWPGAVGYPFRLPDIKYVPPPNLMPIGTPTKIPATVKLPPPPPAPPPIRPVVGGGGSGPK